MPAIHTQQQEKLLIKGILCDGKTSCHTPVALVCGKDDMLHFLDSDFEPVNLESVRISPRLANTSRFIQFPDGSQFETQDNDAVDLLSRRKGGSATYLTRVIYTLETYKLWVLTAFVILIIGSAVFVKYGTPYISHKISMVMPMKVSVMIGDNMEKSLEKYWENTSFLEQDRQQELEHLFTSLLPDNAEEVPWKISFREGGAMGANAFALPNGTIIFTDELIFLSDNDQQLAAIMLHEIGHVQHRHGLRSLIQEFTLALLLMALSGDVSSSSGIITALPVMLLESGYSQDMEWESDTYALEDMLKRGLNPESFAEIMTKLQNQPENREEDHPQESCAEEQASEEEKDGELTEEKQALENDTHEQVEKEAAIWQYFSTHPATAERIERFRAAAEMRTE